MLLPLARIWQQVGAEQRGPHLPVLVRAVAQIGFQAKHGEMPADSLAAVLLPAIAHLNAPGPGARPVVLYHVDRQRVTYIDPADGQLNRAKLSDFQR